MSIWKKPLWGKAKSDTSGLARPSAQRCAFLVADRGLRDLPWFNAVFLGVQWLTGAELIVLAILFESSGTGRGPIEALVGFTKKFVETATVTGVISGTIKLSAFLALVIVGIPAFLRWAHAKDLAGFTRDAAAAARQRRRKSRGLLALRPWLLFLGAFILLCVVLALTTRMGAFSLLPLAWFSNLAGALLILLGLRNRSGSRIVCVRCEYPMNTWRGSAAHCPECGSAWKERWRARLGERRVRWSWIGVGAGLLALAPLITMLVLSGLRSR